MRDVAALPTAVKRTLINRLKQEYPVTALCEVLACSRSAYYYQPQPVDESALVTAIEDVLMRWPFYGYRRVMAQLRREGWSVGEDVTRRLLREMGVNKAVGRVRISTTDSNHTHRRYPNHICDLVITYPDQVWVADITYIRFGLSFLYLAVILDVFTRGVRGWHLGHSLSSETLTTTALRKALAKRTPSFFHSDQGVQYAAENHVALLSEKDVTISMSDKGQPTQNPMAERFIRTVKEEHIDYTEYEDFKDGMAQMRYWLEVTYMTERIHSSLGYLTPVEFEAAYYDKLQPSLKMG
jgi:putative transposase